MRMFCLSSHDVSSETIWRDIEPLLSLFAARCHETSPAQVREGAARELLQVWGIQDAEAVHGIAVTEIIDTPRGNICCLRIGASDGEVPRPLQERLVDEISAWARERGCKALRIVGRKGWLRRLPKFHPTALVMECEL